MAFNYREKGFSLTILVIKANTDTQRPLFVKRKQGLAPGTIKGPRKTTVNADDQKETWTQD